MYDEAFKEIMYKAALAGGEVLQRHYTTGLAAQRFKQDSSWVTTADLESEKAILSIIRDAFPDHSIDSEERGFSEGQSDRYLWRVDPLDGTENFVSGIPYFSVSIALLRDGIAEMGLVYNPISGETYLGRRGAGATLNEKEIHISDNRPLSDCRILVIPDFVTKKSEGVEKLRTSLYQRARRILDTWSPALDWCLVASGRADALISISDRDISENAGILILREAGGTITDFNGNAALGRNLIASGGAELRREILKLIEQSFN